MKREQVIQTIMEVVDKELVVSNLGHPCQELYKVKDRDQNFYMLGSMGQALPIGLGLALSQPEKVIVLEGDGALLMNLGCLTTLARLRPENLLLVILDNNAYGSTGYQATATDRAFGAQLEKIAAACGNLSVTSSPPEKAADHVSSFLQSGRPSILHLPLEKGHEALSPVPLMPEEIKHRFMKALRKGPF